MALGGRYDKRLKENAKIFITASEAASYFRKRNGLIISREKIHKMKLEIHIMKLKSNL